MQPVMAHRINRWQKGHPSPPWELMLCPTHRCNLKCAICSRSWESEINPLLFKELPDERWLTLVEEAAALGVKFLSIGGGGEPTVRRELILNICAKAKSLGMEGSLQTNGTLLTDEDLEKLVDMQWDHMTISLDGPTEEINDAIRYPGAFKQTLTRIKGLVSLKKDKKSTVPSLHINTVVTAWNCNHLTEMVNLCHELGVDEFSVVEMIEYSPDMSSYTLSDEQKKDLQQHLEKAIEEAESLGLPNNLSGMLLQQQAPLLSAGAATAECNHDLTRAYCLEPWRGAVVTSGGQIMPCCFFWDENAENIGDKTLQDLWYGSYLTRFRENMLAGDLPDQCRQCAFPDSHIHRKLRQCLSAEKITQRRLREKLLQIPHYFTKLQQYGLKGMLKRFKEKRKIQRALKKEDS